MKLVHENLAVLIVSVIKTSVFQKPIPWRCPLYTDHHHPHLSPCGHVGLERSSPPTLLDFVASSLKINLNPCEVAKCDRDFKESLQYHIEEDLCVNEFEEWWKSYGTR